MKLHDGKLLVTTQLNCNFPFGHWRRHRCVVVDAILKCSDRFQYVVGRTKITFGSENGEMCTLKWSHRMQIEWEINFRNAFCHSFKVELTTIHICQLFGDGRMSEWKRFTFIYTFYHFEHFQWKIVLLEKQTFKWWWN